MGHIFISYSHKDTKYAHELAGNLQSMGFEVWIDERLDYGAQWPQELQKQLDSCSAFILIMSRHSYASEWVQSELQRAKRKLKPIFPLLLDGDEPWLSVESTQYYDVRESVNPDPRFYSALKNVIAPIPTARTLQTPKGAGIKKPANDSSKLKIGIVVAILLVFVGGAIWLSSALSKNSIKPTEPAGISAIEKPSSEESTSIPEESVAPEMTASPQLISSGEDKMTLIPAGEFTMGRSAKDEFTSCQELNQDCQLSAFMDEEPVHQVLLDAFSIDKNEVTNALYKACEDQGACTAPQASNSNTQSNYYGNPEFDNYPVIYVTWEQAKTYCEWRGVRLPTEAEWEKAARGSDERTYPWGEKIDESFANFNYAVSDTTTVGSYGKGKSLYGVYDMAGNVWEWVADWYSDTYYGRSPAENPSGPASGEMRVLRGGSWGLVGVSVSTSYRYARDPAESSPDLGFRCAKDANP
jgi:formylglycine-generating enzyme required for sulfatase activity